MSATTSDSNHDIDVELAKHNEANHQADRVHLMDSFGAVAGHTEVVRANFVYEIDGEPIHKIVSAVCLACGADVDDAGRTCPYEYCDCSVELDRNRVKCPDCGWVDGIDMRRDWKQALSKQDCNRGDHNDG